LTTASHPDERTIMNRIPLLLLLAILARGPAAAEPARPDALGRALARAEGAERILDPAREDSLLAAEADLPTAARMGRWARRFAAAEGVTYVFGPAEGGYVADGALVRDRHQDCIGLLYRVGELARADDHEDAVRWALRTRFAAADPESVVGPDGRVDYDHPAHLDYSLDMIRSGLWGRDVTAGLSGAVPDSAGTSRYPAGSYMYVPKTDLAPGELREGDVAWFVLDPAHEGAARLRREYGLAIGHVGIVIVEDGVPLVVHAASSGLEGRYEGGTVVTVPLVEYLARVERFAGIVVTRF